MELRWYQQESKDAIYKYLRCHKTGNPCVVLPTGAGKTPLLAQLCADAVQKWGVRVCVLAHVKELLEQAADKLASFLPPGDVRNPTVGMYSAGLGQKATKNPVIVAGIQSAYKNALKLCDPRPISLIIIDEAHLVPAKDAGMYRTFIDGIRKANPRVRIVGLTATPYRLDSGMIYGGEDNIFTDMVYEANIKQLILQGFLCPLRSKRGTEHANLDNVTIRGGEYVAGEMTDAFDGIVAKAVEEILLLTKERRSGLIFCAGVKHAHTVQDLIVKSGLSCGVVTGDTPKEERSQLLADFKAGRLRYMANVNVLTTGFDAPNVDSVSLLRATLSPGLYYQMIGRGLRVYPDKQDCLVLDYGENVATHGPIDMIRPPKLKGEGTGDAALKECPSCHEMVFAGFSKCPECGHEFAQETILHNHVAATDGVVSGEITTEEVYVESVGYFIHRKRGQEDNPDIPPTLRVDYRASGLNGDRYSEWLCFDERSNPWAVQKAADWWTERTLVPVPRDVSEAMELASADVLRCPSQVTIRKEAGNPFTSIIGWELSEMLTAAECEKRLAAKEIAMREMVVEMGAAPAAITTEERNWFDADDIPF